MEGVPAASTLDACIVPDEKGTSSSELGILTLVVVTYFGPHRVFELPPYAMRVWFCSTQFDGGAFSAGLYVKTVSQRTGFLGDMSKQGAEW